MKKTTKQLVTLMLILGVGCILEGCGKESNHSVTITLIHAWGGTEEDHVAMREIYEEFQEENPDINLQMISMPTREDMMRKVEDMIMVGNIPDIVSFSGTGENNTYDFMIENNMALDIYPYMQQDQEFADSISEVNKEYWSTENGELYSVADARMLSGGYWYNEDILKAAGIEKVPKSWDEFQTMCDQISEWALNEKNEVKALQPTAEGYLYCMDHMLAGSEDSRFEGHNLIFQDEIFNNAINRMKRMYNSAISENAEYSYRDETHLFNEGKLAIYINGVWGAPMISKQIDAKYALLPTDGGESMSCISSGLGYVLGNSGNEEKEKAAIILENTRVMKNTYTSQLTDQEKQIQSEIDAYQTQLNQLEAEIQAITANSLIINPNYIGGEMLWPVPGYTKLSSTFKMRVHPITGVYKLHTGIDIPAPIGTNFLAANEGIVVKASYNSAYGNMVMVDHGGGVSTLYAHGDEIMVTLGQTVKKGDVVLKTGNTGNSTGPHAHFEVRINGTPVDPLPYVTHKDGVN